MRVKPGGKNSVKMRDGRKQDGTPQKMEFDTGDVVRVPLNLNDNLKSHVWGNENVADRIKDSPDGMPIGAKVHDYSDLRGVSKGMKQVILERIEHGDTGLNDTPTTSMANCKRKAELGKLKKDGHYGVDVSLIECDCFHCQLGDQEDFKSQRSLVDEIFDDYPNQRCVFLPKFHPELNPIERVWASMKYHLKSTFDWEGERHKARFFDAVKKAGEAPIISQELCTKHFETSMRYAEGYRDQRETLMREEWTAKRKSHRGFSEGMDKAFLEEERDEKPTTTK